MEHTIGLFANPIYVSGDYSPMLRNMIQNHDSNRAVGSVLPLFTEAEKVEIKGQNIFYMSRETVFYFAISLFTNAEKVDIEGQNKFLCITKIAVFF